MSTTPSTDRLPIAGAPMCDVRTFTPMRGRVSGTHLRLLAAKARPVGNVRSGTELSVDVCKNRPIGPAGTGYLYVIHFNTRAIKVGQTTDMNQRYRQHRSEARPFGAFPIAVWSFGWYRGFLGDEVKLINHCVQRGGLRVRNEYFLNLDFRDTYRFAESLVPFVAESGETR